jgi:hypothetical protein
VREVRGKEWDQRWGLGAHARQMRDRWGRAARPSIQTQSRGGIGACREQYPWAQPQMGAWKIDTSGDAEQGVRRGKEWSGPRTTVPSDRSIADRISGRRHSSVITAQAPSCPSRKSYAFAFSPWMSVRFTGWCYRTKCINTGREQHDSPVSQRENAMITITIVRSP